MKKFSSTLSRTMEIMINPPIRSPSMIDMVLARIRMMTRGLANRRRKLRSAAKRDSLIKLFGP